MIYASQIGAKLDSHVINGGGTDDTHALQQALNIASEKGSLTLFLDGAARISAPLRIHSNTTIICPNSCCGLFLSNGANCAMLQNADPSQSDIRNVNISLKGGSYNHNAANQTRMVDTPSVPENLPMHQYTVAMMFFGVENLLIRDVTILNQRTYATFFSNWRHIIIENVHIDLREHMDGEIQDALHFHGPGRFLTIRDVRGTAGDDFIAILPDEHDYISSIEDVIVDGVQLNGSDQGVRLLSRGKGRVDRIQIRNITGTYRSYGFIINPWYPTREGGNIGAVSIDTVDLRALKNNYDYASPFLFKLGGNVESISLRNIRHHAPQDARQLIKIGGNYIVDFDTPMDEQIVHAIFIERRRDIQETEERARLGRELSPTHIGYLEIDNLCIYENRDDAKQQAYIRNLGQIDNMRISNFSLNRTGMNPNPYGVLLRNEGEGKIGELRIDGAMENGLCALVKAPDGSIARLSGNSVQRRKESK